MDNDIAAGTARAGRSPVFQFFNFKKPIDTRWRAAYRVALTLLLFVLGTGLHLSSSDRGWVISPSTARADSIQYVYDQLGRLVQASDQTTGQAVFYVYDAVGNITSQTTTALSTLAVNYFTPNHGPVGTQVTLIGTGFSPTSSADIVTFNGVAATVVSATQTQLVVTVPSAATSGPISVSTGSASATSTASFTLTAVGDSPVITGLDPAVGTAGELVTVIGTGFESQPADDRVRFDATSAQVTASTSTAITSSVPAGSNSGKVYLTTPRGMAVSPMDFIVVPSGYSASSIGTTGRMTTDGSTTGISLPTANKIGVELFDGNIGDLLTIGVGSTSLASATIKVFNPDGSLLTSGSVTATGQGVQLPPLAQGGTYTIVVDPGSNTGTLALDIVRPLQGTLALNGAPTSLDLVPPGQRALLTFSGTQGTYANVTLSWVTVSAGTVSLIGPNGGVVDTENFTTTGVSLQPQLPANGTYTVLISPNGSIGGSLSVALTTSTSPTLSLNQGYSLTVPNTTPVSLSLEGTAGQYLALNASTTHSGIGSYTISMLAPDGTQVASGTLSTGSGAGTVVVNVGPLSIGGTYSAVVQANGSGSGVVTLTLSTPQMGVLATDGSSASASIGTAGQGLLYTSTLSAGQYLSFAVSEPNPGGINAAAITVLRPDGTLLTSGTLTTTYTSCTGTCLGGTSGYSGSTVLSLGPLPESGTYTFLFRQTGTGAADTSGLTLTLVPLAAGTLTVNNTSSVSLASPGEGLMYNFAGTAGQYLSVGLQESYDNIPGAVIAVMGPDGSVLGTGALATTLCGGLGCPGKYSGATVVNFGPLTTTGNYTVWVLQSTAGTGTLGVTLSSPITGTLTAGTTSNVPGGSLPGQPFEMTFAGTQGQYASLEVGDNGTLPGATITVLNPDGTVLATGTLTPTFCGGIGCSGEYEGSTVVNLGPFPATGTYTVLIRQVTGGTGGLGVTLAAPATGTLSVNTPTNTSASLLGQPIELPFAGSTGQYLAVGVSETNGAITAAKISVLGPDGSVLNTGTLTATYYCLLLFCEDPYSGSAVVNIGPLPSSGNYNVLIQQASAGTATLAVGVSSPADGGMLTPGAPLTISASMLGQPLQAEFAGTAGTSITVNLAESGVAGSAITVLGPDGAPFYQGNLTASCNSSGCTGTTNVYPDLLLVSGTYTMILRQSSTGTAAATFTANGVSVPAAGVTTLTPAAGQPASLTFNGVAGQNVSFALSATTVASNGGTSFGFVLSYPDGTQGSSWFPNMSSEWEYEWAPFRLPESGTYTLSVIPYSGQTINATDTVSVSAAGVLAVGSTRSVNLATLGQSAIYSFEATAGESVTLYVGGISTTPTNVSMGIEVVNPGGAVIASNATASYSTFELGNLPAGTYWVHVYPTYPCTSAFQMTLQPASNETIPVNGTVTNFSTSALRQVAGVSFSGTAGQHVSLAVNNVVMTPGTTTEYWLQLNKPDGSPVWAGWWFTNNSGFEWAPYILPETGTYTVDLYPSDPETLTGSATVSADVTGTLSVGAATNVNLPAVGQSALYSFTATDRQSLVLNVSAVATTPANTAIQVTVFNSSGTVVSPTQTGSNLIFNLPNLVADTYTVLVSPQYPATSSLQITLQPGVVSTVPTNGSPTNFDLSLPFEVGYLGFYGTAGESVTVAFSNIDRVSSWAQAYWLQINNPDGSQSWGNYFFGNPFVWPMWSLPQTGLYTMTFWPHYPGTMSGTVTVSQNVIGSLSVGSPVSVNLPAVGQSAAYTFTATAGQTFALNVSGITTTPANTNLGIQVFNSSGQAISPLTQTSTSATLNLYNLAADTYTVRVYPTNPCTSTLQIALQAVVVATLPANGTSVSVSTSVPSQNAYFTIAGTAGQNIGVGLTNLVMTPNSVGSINLSLYNPDGSYWWGRPCNVSDPVSSCGLQYVNIPTTGNYTLIATPSGAATMSFNLTISQALTTALTSGTPQGVSTTVPGQFELLSFSASAGQGATVTVGSISTTPANVQMYVAIIDPNGNSFTNQSSATGMTFNLTNLSAGVYKVFVVPYFAATGSAQVSVTLH